MSRRERGDVEQARGKPFGLISLLAPLTLDQFIAGPFGRTPIHLAGPKRRFRPLLDWDALARLLENTPLEPPRLEVVKSGKRIPPENYLRDHRGFQRLDGGALSLLLDTGASLIINLIDDLVPAISKLADDVGDHLGARTAVNLYATWRTERGLDPHWDGHDVLVLQLAGRKEWPIYKPVMADPTHNKAFEELPAGSELESAYTLEDGDVLYLPRGWIHAPSPLDEPSLHLTVSITRPTGAGFLKWLASDLESDSRIRAAIPPISDETAFTEWHSLLSSIVHGAIHCGALERFLANWDSEHPARPRFSFSDFGRTPQAKWTSSTMVRLASMHRLPVESTANGGAQMTAAGRAWPCSLAVAGVLRRLSSTRPMQVGALMDGLSTADAAQLRQLLGLLGMAGLLETVRD